MLATQISFFAPLTSTPFFLKCCVSILKLQIQGFHIACVQFCMQDNVLRRSFFYFYSSRMCWVILRILSWSYWFFPLRKISSLSSSSWHLERRWSWRWGELLLKRFVDLVDPPHDFSLLINKITDKYIRIKHLLIIYSFELQWLQWLSWRKWPFLPIYQEKNNKADKFLILLYPKSFLLIFNENTEQNYYDRKIRLKTKF